MLLKIEHNTLTVVNKRPQDFSYPYFVCAKVKYTQQNFHDRLSQIQDFPKLNDERPFYADLINVLYDMRTITKWLWVSLTQPDISSIGT